ncbi:MAG: polysaccharide pyruvyl transferase family protein [Candidatus Bathyarchaeia archaeon]
MKIVIACCWSYYNKGDAAIALATIKLIQKIVPNVEITMLAFDHHSFIKHKKELGDSIKVLPMPSITDSLQPLRVLFGTASRVALKGLFGPLFLILSLALMPLLKLFDSQLKCTLRSIDDSHLVIIVGGNYLYSHFGFYIHAIPIVYAKFLRKKKTVMLGHSIGPFEDALSRTVARIILYRMNLVTYREELSSLYVRKNLNVNAPNMFVSCDMSFFLQSPKTTCEVLESQPRVGITVRKWLFNQPNLYKRYIDSITQTAFNLMKDGFEVYLIPFSYIGGGEDDLGPCKIIYSKLSTIYPKKVYLLNVKEESPTSLVKIMGKLGLHIFIGTRMHSVIMASLARIPSIIISYQHFKAHGISQQLGLHNYVISIENITPHRLMTCVEKLLKHYERERTNLIMTIQQLKKINERKICSALLSLIHVD